MSELAAAEIDDLATVIATVAARISARDPDLAGDPLAAELARSLYAAGWRRLYGSPGDAGPAS